MPLPRPKLVSAPDYANVLALDMGALPMITAMEQNGVLIDTSRLSSIAATIREERESLESEMRSLAGNQAWTSFPGGAYNPASGDQIEHMVFSLLGVHDRGVKMTKSRKRRRADKKTLEGRAGEHPFIPLQQRWTELEKLRSTYVDKLPRIIDSDGRLHGDILYTRADTGRLAMKNPNLQNTPVRSRLGKEIRKAFVARPGCVIVALDQGQIEMRVTAHCSGDEGMIQVYLDNDDLHWRTAEAVFGKPREELDEDVHRKPCKNIGFGVLYGITAEGLRDQIVVSGGDPEFWTLERCEGLIAEFFRARPGVAAMMRRYHSNLRRYGFVWDMFGRVRWLESIWLPDDRTKEEALRAAGNMPIQSGAGGTLKLAMADTWPLAVEFDSGQGQTCKPLLQIHDELLWEMSEGQAEEFSEVIQMVMEGVIELRVPIECSRKIGESWGELEDAA